MGPSDVEHLALQFVPGAGRLVIDRLGSGLVNESYRIARGGRRFSLRIPSPHAAQLGLDRAWECRVLERAAAAGLAPEVECCEPRRGILVARWVEGHAWTLEQARRPENIEQVAHFARQIHSLRVPRGPRVMNPSAWIAHYQGALGRDDGNGAPQALPTGGQSQGLQFEANALLAALAALPPVAAVLCHSDLHPQNLVIGEHGLVLLDWEYAHVSEPLWDMAGWICNSDLTPDMSRLLLESYLMRQSMASEWARLQVLVWLYDYVCLLWCELYMKLRPGRGHDIDARAQLLAARLQPGTGSRAGQLPAH